MRVKTQTIKRFFMTKILANFKWIDDLDGALNLVARLQADNDYAIDTEFERSSTYYLNPALLQISCEGQVYLVDIAIDDIAKTVLSAIKGMVLHSGSEDLELYTQVTGIKPERVFDTQVAAALSGYSLHTSYLNLVQELMGVELDKAMSRSDWLARPLSDEQLQYAVEDIAYLDEFKVQLTERMESRGMLPLFDVLMAQMIAQIDQDKSNEKLFQKWVKSERLNAHEAKRLWLVLHWRNQMARQRNKPKNWILNPQQVVAVVKRAQRFEDLFDLGLHPKFVKINGRELLDTLHNENHECLADLPQPIKLNSRQGLHLKEMKARLKQVSERHGIEPSIIINTQALKKLAFEGGELADLPTWQALL